MGDTKVEDFRKSAEKLGKSWGRKGDFSVFSVSSPKLWLAALLAGLLLAVYVPPFQKATDQRATDQRGVDQQFVEGHIVRTVDSEAGVVCWVYFATGGIACLPLSETKLGGETGAQLGP